MAGLIEQHTHGGMGHEFISGSVEDNISIGEYLSTQGITTVVPTFITSSTEKLIKAVKAINLCHRDERFLPEIGGVFFEGPFISPHKKGVHESSYIKEPDGQLAKKLLDLPDKELRKIILLPPEMKGAIDLMQELTEAGVIVTGGHSRATYEESLKAIEAGMTGITHLWNAMSSYHHRDPGLPGAALQSQELIAELICDFIHIHKTIVRDTILRKGVGNISLISDMTGPGGLKDGSYEWDGRKVSVSSKWGIRLIDESKGPNASDWPLAGSNLDTRRMFMNILSLGFSVEDFVTMRATTPAKFLKLESVGTLTEGGKANITVLSTTGEPLATIVKGRFTFLNKKVKPANLISDKSIC
jgi:N-acetylglucosamine-6-phosphate deacetylase